MMKMQVPAYWPVVEGVHLVENNGVLLDETKVAIIVDIELMVEFEEDGDMSIMQEVILIQVYAGLVNTVEEINASEERARLDSNIRDSKMVMVLLMKEKQRGRKVRCGWGKVGREKAQLREKWSSLYAFQIYAKSVKEATVFDLDPRAERGTRKCKVGHVR